MSVQKNTITSLAMSLVITLGMTACSQNDRLDLASISQAASHQESEAQLWKIPLSDADSLREDYEDLYEIPVLKTPNTHLTGDPPIAYRILCTNDSELDVLLTGLGWSAAEYYARSPHFEDPDVEDDPKVIEYTNLQPTDQPILVCPANQLTSDLNTPLLYVSPYNGLTKYFIRYKDQDSIRNHFFEVGCLGLLTGLGLHPDDAQDVDLDTLLDELPDSAVKDISCKAGTALTDEFVHACEASLTSPDYTDENEFFYILLNEWEGTQAQTCMDLNEDLKSKTEISLNDLMLPTISPLKHFEQITKLEIADNLYIEDLAAITSMRNLISLDAQENAITSLTALTSLRRMKILNVSNNPDLENILPLARLRRLTDINLRGTAVSDIRALSRVGTLEILNILETEVTDLTPLKNLRRIETLEVDWTLIDPAKCPTDARSDALAKPCQEMNDQFSADCTQAFEQGVNDSRYLTFVELMQDLNVDSCAALAEMVKGLTTVNLDNPNITDIDPLRYITNLSALDIVSTAVTDLTPLADLAYLESVTADWSNIDPDKCPQDAQSSFLADQCQLFQEPLVQECLQAINDDNPNAPRRLTYLNLFSAMSVANCIELVEQIPSVLSLTLNDPAVYDLQPVSYFTKLSTLDISQTQATDLTPLKGLQYVTSLAVNLNLVDPRLCPLEESSASLIAKCELINVDFVRGCFQSVHRDSNGEQNDFYTSLLASQPQDFCYELWLQAPSIAEVEMNNIGIQDPSPLRYFTGLTKLSLADNNITDLSSLAPLTKLTHLVLRDNPSLSNIDVVSNFTNLVELDISNTSVQSLNALRGLANLTRVLVDIDEIAFYSCPTDAQAEVVRNICIEILPPPVLDISGGNERYVYRDENISVDLYPGAYQGSATAHLDVESSDCDFMQLQDNKLLGLAPEFVFTPESCSMTVYAKDQFGKESSRVTITFVFINQVSKLALGLGHTCALLDNGRIRCWGNNYYGQLGYSTRDNMIGHDRYPSTIDYVDLGPIDYQNGDFTGVAKDIVAGSHFVCALTINGKVKCWGRNLYGQLGLGSTNTVGDDEHPKDVGFVELGSLVTDLSAGSYHVCALLDTQEVQCWGYNRYGQLGYGNTENIGDNESPIDKDPIDLRGKVVAITSGAYHNCAVLTSGALRCWGYNNYGQLGYGHKHNIGDYYPPRSYNEVPVGSAVKSVKTGIYHTCAVLDNNYVRCWGLNSSGQLGYGHKDTIGDDEEPESTYDYAYLPDYVNSLSLGGYFSCALLNNKNVQCWGANRSGQLGYGHTSLIGDDEEIRDQGTIQLNYPIKEIASGTYHSCAILDDSAGEHKGKVMCWGDSMFGMLGHGNYTELEPNQGDPIYHIGDDELPHTKGFAKILEAGHVFLENFNAIPSIPSGLRVLCHTEGGQTSQSCPIIIHDDITYWTLSFLDNRSSLAVVGYDQDGTQVSAQELTGARYVRKIEFDVDEQEFTFTGQAARTVTLPASRLGDNTL